MKQLGRKSKAASVIPFPTAGGHPPPADLTPEESAIWMDITAKMPRDWFAVQNLPLLTQYCRHTARASRIAKMITAHESNPEGSAYQYDNLLKMQSRETANLCSLATKMRLAQSAIDETKAGRPTVKASAKPIWQP